MIQHVWSRQMKPQSKTERKEVHQKKKSAEQTVALALCHFLRCRSTALSRNILLASKTIFWDKIRFCFRRLMVGSCCLLVSTENVLAREASSPDSIFPDIDKILVLLFPGVVISFVRSKFLTRKISPQNQLIYYCAVSVVYYVLVWLPVNASSFIEELDYQNPWHMFFLLLVGPVVLGGLFGYESRREYVHRFIRWVGLGNLTHPVESAWDWKFMNTNDEWVIVTLKDGTRFAGFYGTSSFASSDPQKRDIYIQWVHDIDEEGKWIYAKVGVLVTSGEVKTIEFLMLHNHPNYEGGDNEKG